MFNFTKQERQVILFLISVALIGLGINFAIKVNCRIEKFVRVDNAIAKIDINQATFEDFLGTSSITPNLAKKIIEHRNSHGSFRDLEELKEIKGIGDYRYEKLKHLFVVK